MWSDIWRAVTKATSVVGCMLLVACNGGTSEVDTGVATTATSEEVGASAENETEEVIDFTWTTSYVGDGYGATVEVTGIVGDDWAHYSMHATPVFGTEAGDYADLIPMMVGAGVNGFADSPAGGGLPDTIDPEGATEIRVADEARWYRLPWLLDEARDLLDGAEWLRVEADAPTPTVDLVTYVVAERFDDAVRALREAAAQGASFTPPSAPEDDELTALFGPWVGAEVAIEPTGNHAEGAAAWGVTYTYEPDGVDGYARGEVSWRTATGARPDHPAAEESVDAKQLSTAMR